MKGINLWGVLFCTGKGAESDEAYRRLLCRRSRVFWGILALGVLTLAVAVGIGILYGDAGEEHSQVYFYAGVGTGLIVGAIIGLLRVAAILRSPEKLHQKRLECSDERLREIALRALATAGLALLLIAYLVCLIGGLFYPALSRMMLPVIMLFFCAYFISHRIWDKRM